MESLKAKIGGLTEIDLLELADLYDSATSIIRKHFGSNCDKYGRIILDKLELFDIQFLNPYVPGSSRRIHNKIIKECPVCGQEYETNDGPEEKMTCSYSCRSRKRTGVNGANYIHGRFIGSNTYRKRALEAHGVLCVVCQTDEGIDVHHIDEDKTNHKLENLVPLCKVHHNWIHSEKRKKSIEYKIIDFINKYKENK